MDTAASLGRAEVVGEFSASLLAWLVVAVTIVVGVPFQTALSDDECAIPPLPRVALDPVVVRAMLDVAVTPGVALELLPICVMLGVAAALGVALKLTARVVCEPTAVPGVALELAA